MKLSKLSLVAILVSISLPAFAQTTGSLQRDIDMLKEDVASIQRNMHRSSDSNMEGTSDVLVKMGQMDELFRSTSGKIEEMEYKLKALENRIDMINKDMDIRFKMLEDGHVQAPSTPPASIIGTDVTEKLEGSIEELYQRGLDAVKANDNQTAINAFSKILSDNPDHKLAGNAQYWLGETYYAGKDFNRAAVAFGRGYEKYSKTTKGPDNLLKLGMTMVELNKLPEACAAFTTLPKEFANASESVKNKAADLAKKHACN